MTNGYKLNTQIHQTPDQVFDMQLARTLTVVRELAQGKRLRIGDRELAMGEDMSIGFIITGSDGVDHIGGLSTVDLSELNTLLNHYDINVIIGGHNG